MARRVASVELELKAGQYVAEAGKVELRTKAARSEIKDLGESADKSAAELKVLGHEANVAGRDLGTLSAKAALAQREMDALSAGVPVVRGKFDDFNKSSTHATSGLSLLQEQIRNTEQELKRLADEYARTSDKVTLTSFKRNQSILNDLKRLERTLTPAAAAKVARVPQVTSSIFGGIGSGFGDLPGGAKGMLIATLVGAGALAAPEIGAMIGAAVTGAAGIGGIAGGIVAASHSQGVKAAAIEAGQSISADFFASGDAFVAPVQRSLGVLAKDFHDLNLGSVFATVAPSVEELAAGLGNLAKAFMPGFKSALVSAGPVLHELAQDMPMLGREFGNFFDTIGKGKGNVEGMRALMGLLSSALAGTAHAVSFLSDRYHDLVGVMIDVSDRLINIPLIGGWFNGVRDAAHGLQDPVERTTAVMAKMGDTVQSTVNPNLAAAQSAAGVAVAYNRVGAVAVTTEQNTASLEAATAAYVRQLDEQAKSLVYAKQAFEDLMKAQTDYLDLTLRTMNANLAWKQDFFDLRHAVKENGTTLDETTEKGLANAKMLESMAGDAQRVRDELLKNPATAATANAAYLSMMKQLEAFAIKLGMSKSAVHALLDELLWLASNGNITVGVDIVSGGESHAAGISHGPAKKPPAKKPPAGGKDLIPKHAAGGFDAPGWNWYGEAGKELHWSSAPGYTMTAKQSQAFMGAASGGGHRTFTIIVADTSGRTLRNVFIDEAKGRAVAEDVIRAAYP